MVECRAFGPLRPAEPRSILARRRRRARQRIGILALAAGVACAATLVARPAPQIIWNASASSPRGLYRIIDHQPPRRGDIVLARLSPAFEALAARRHYLPAGVPLVKRVAAEPGDHVCSKQAGLIINHRLAAQLKNVDGNGRPLPRWAGCRVLGDDELLLLGQHPWSFDGRYVGPTKRRDVLARVALLWSA